jgi:hypothetical protein
LCCMPGPSHRPPFVQLNNNRWKVGILWLLWPSTRFSA